MRPVSLSAGSSGWSGSGAGSRCGPVIIASRSASSGSSGARLILLSRGGCLAGRSISLPTTFPLRLLTVAYAMDSDLQVIIMHMLRIETIRHACQLCATRLSLETSRAVTPLRSESPPSPQRAAIVYRKDTTPRQGRKCRFESGWRHFQFGRMAERSIASGLGPDNRARTTVRGFESRSSRPDWAGSPPNPYLGAGYPRLARGDFLLCLIRVPRR